MKLHLTQIQDAYPGSTSGFLETHGPHYTALATDEQENTYDIVWECTHIDAEDGSEACDWDKYHVYKDGELLSNSDIILEEYTGEK